jgi:fermentation-respiration switch protein FrsA (DUF1100 family)
VPVLIVHGTKDGRIPVAQGHAVFEAIPDGRKEFLDLPDAGHDDLVNQKRAPGKTTLKRLIEFFHQTAHADSKA